MTVLTASALHGSDPEHLLACIGGGSVEAFAAFYDRMVPLVERVSRRLVGDRRLAEEVVEDVFLAVWRGARGYDPDRQDAVDWVLATTCVAVVKQRRASAAPHRA